jgi:hypothetical protein
MSITYVKIKTDDAYLILAKERLGVIKTNMKLLKSTKEVN